MKTVYFVRHGESEGNAGPVQGGPTSPLTEKGKKQALEIAKRCSRLTVDVIISSTFSRTEQTTGLISKGIGKPVEFSDLFVERRRPSVQIGKLRTTPEWLETERAVMGNFAKPRYRHSDEENFDDLKDRAGRALKFLGGRPENDILVVTHGLFMRILVAYMVFGKELTGRQCELFMRKFHMENTGLTIFCYDARKIAKGQSPWWLWIWNDHSHLG